MSGFHVPGSKGRMSKFQGPRSQGSGSQGPGSRVSGPDFRLCPWKSEDSEFFPNSLFIGQCNGTHRFCILKALRNYILRIIRVWLLLFATGSYLSVCLPSIISENLLFVFLCFIGFMSALSSQDDGN